MKKYLGSYLSQSDVQNALDNGTLKKPYVAAINNVTVDYDSAERDYTNDYLTFEITSPGNINWKATNENTIKTIYYSKDDGLNWTELTSTVEGNSFSVNAGDKVMFKGNNGQYGGGGYANSHGSNFSGTTAGFNVYGNIASMMTTDFVSGANMTQKQAFEGLFMNCTGLVSAKNLVLSTVKKVKGYAQAGSYCFEDLFNGCTSLVEPPKDLDKLPRLGSYYFAGMFSNCTSLTKLPPLGDPVTSYCYRNMFAGCTAITFIPDNYLSTNLTQNCYEGMFSNCTSLTTAPALTATTLANDCYASMFMGCSSLTTAPALPATTLAQGCYHGMFYNCTSLTTAPELPATTLQNRCYNQMFVGCSSLNYVKCLATDISASVPTMWWLNGVSQTGTFVKAAGMNDWQSGVDGIPSGWTVVEE